MSVSSPRGERITAVRWNEERNAPGSANMWCSGTPNGIRVAESPSTRAYRLAIRPRYRFGETATGECRSVEVHNLRVWQIYHVHCTISWILSMTTWPRI